MVVNKYIVHLLDKYMKIYTMHSTCYIKFVQWHLIFFGSSTWTLLYFTL